MKALPTLIALAVIRMLVYDLYSIHPTPLIRWIASIVGIIIIGGIFYVLYTWIKDQLPPY